MVKHSQVGVMDYTVRLWDTATGHHMQTFSGHPRRIGASSGGITWLQFSPTEDTLFSRSEDGTIHLWDATHIVESDAIVSISPTSIKSPTVGEQFSLDVTIADAENNAGYEITLEYDPTVLRYVSANKGDYLPENAVFNIEERRTMKVVEFHNVSYPHRLKLTSKDEEGRLEEGKVDDGVLASITFEVIKPKTSTITLKEVRLETRDSIIARPRIKHGIVLDPNLTQRKPGDNTQLGLPKGRDNSLRERSRA